VKSIVKETSYITIDIIGCEQSRNKRMGDVLL